MVSANADFMVWSAQSPFESTCFGSIGCRSCFQSNRAWILRSILISVIGPADHCMTGKKALGVPKAKAKTAAVKKEAGVRSHDHILHTRVVSFFSLPANSLRLRSIMTRLVSGSTPRLVVWILKFLSRSRQKSGLSMAHYLGGGLVSLGWGCVLSYKSPCQCVVVQRGGRLLLGSIDVKTLARAWSPACCMYSVDTVRSVSKTRSSQGQLATVVTLCAFGVAKTKRRPLSIETIAPPPVADRRPHRRHSCFIRMRTTPMMSRIWLRDSSPSAAR